MKRLTAWESWSLLGGALVAVLRNRAEIVLADVNRQPPKSAARPFPVALIRSADVAMVASPSVEWMAHAKPFPRSERPDTPLLPLGAAVPLGGLAGAEARAGRIAERRPRRELLGRDLAHP